MVMHSTASTKNVSLSREPPKYLSNAAHKHGVIDKGKYKQQSGKWKWTEMDYHVQGDSDVSHKDVNMFLNTNQLP